MTPAGSGVTAEIVEGPHLCVGFCSELSSCWPTNQFQWDLGALSGWESHIGCGGCGQQFPWSGWRWLGTWVNQLFIAVM